MKPSYLNSLALDLFLVLAFASACIYHFYGLFYMVNEVPAWRHATFVVIDGIVAYAFLAPFKYFKVLFVLMTIQQLASHGSMLMNSWLNDRTIHWISLLVLIVMMAGLLRLFCGKAGDFRFLDYLAKFLFPPGLL